MSDAINPVMNPWHPIKDAVTLKHLGKLGEEAGELVSVTNRCIIQGVDEAHPTTGKVNREWLEDEMADVLAGIKLNVKHLDLDWGRIVARSKEKEDQLSEWHRMA